MRPRSLGAAPTILLLAGLAAAGPLAGQGPPRVDLAGPGDPAIDRRLRALLQQQPLIVSSDTLIPVDGTVPRSVLVLDATLILEGRVEGDLVVVDGGAFVRPGSRVTGDVVNIAGGIYRTELPSIGGHVVDLPMAKYEVIREPDRFVIRASGGYGPVVLDGAYGFHIPTYDRANGVTPVWGATVRGPYLGALRPALHVQGGWQTERGEATYEADAELRWDANVLHGGYERAYATNERWIRGDLRNSLNYLWDGDDYRDYYDATRAWVGVARELGDPEKRFFAVVGVRGQVEDAESLPAGNPWHIWGDSVRPNLPIDDGRISSVVADATVQWQGRLTAFEGAIAYEAARDWMDGDYEFDRVTATGSFAMQALANHTLEIEVHAQIPVGEDTLPRQRWSFVGGSGTLQTTDFAEFRGDHVIFVETKYIIPLPERLRLPMVGVPELQLVHGAGMAWVADQEDRELRQEIGARLNLFVVYFRYMVEPSNTSNSDLDIGLTLPFGSAFPWED